MPPRANQPTHDTSPRAGEGTVSSPSAGTPPLVPSSAYKISIRREEPWPKKKS